VQILGVVTLVSIDYSLAVLISSFFLSTVAAFYMLSWYFIDRFNLFSMVTCFKGSIYFAGYLLAGKIVSFFSG
jgi:hypothetical protein